MNLVIIPTYNEQENISDILIYVMQMEGDFHVLVIDDASPDGTADLVKNLQKKPENAALIAKPKKK